MQNHIQQGCKQLIQGARVLGVTKKKELFREKQFVEDLKKKRSYESEK